jgi:exosortase A-associated hydrolase 1
MNETAIGFECQGDPLVGILHRPERPKRRGVLIIVGGGPQYRVGVHRQFVLWARRLAAEGYPVMRFDHRGMGDSYGDFRGFEWIDEDISAALARFTAEVPELEEVVLWGECDAASAILFYAYRDPRVRGLVLLNPWARTEVGEAKTVLRHYYPQRLMQPSFWLKVVRLRFNPLDSLRSVWELVNRVRRGRGSAETMLPDQQNLGAALSRDLPLPDRLLAGFSRFQGPVLLVMSGRDLVMREFDDWVRHHPDWQRQLPLKPVTRRDLAEADHTFSTIAWSNQVIDWAMDWLNGGSGDPS